MQVFLHEDQHDPLQVEPEQLLGRHLALLSHSVRQTAEQFELHFALHPELLLLLLPLDKSLFSQLVKMEGRIAALNTGREANAACLKNSLRDCNSLIFITIRI